jgi:hypothetical protein
MKTNFRGKVAPTEAITPKLKRGELKQLEAAWKGPLRSSGFHEFCASDEVQEQMPTLLEERETSRREAAERTGKERIPERSLNAHHAIKTSLWGELSEKEKKEWENAAQESTARYHLSKDR